MKTSRSGFSFVSAHRFCSFKYRGIVAATACILLSLSASTHAETINFDDIAFPGGNPLAVSTLAAGYHGLDWTNWNVSPNDATGWYGGTLQPYSHSGNDFAWSNGSNPYQTSVHGGGTFDLTSFWARTWPNASVSITVHGFLNGVQTFSQTFPLTQNYVQITTNFIGIDSFTSNAGQQFLIDDFVVSNIRAVPEPSTIVLSALAAIGVCLHRLRQIKRA